MRNIRRATKKVFKAGLPLPLKGNASCRGQALPEFAFVAMTFFLLAFALMDFSWLMFNQMNMQDAVREAGRYASTGNYKTPPGPGPASTTPRADSIIQILRQAAVGANIDSVVISSSSGGTWSTSTGGPSDTVKITAVCDVPLLTTTIGSLFGSDNKFHFTVSSTFKNEPFPATTPIQ